VTRFYSMVNFFCEITITQRSKQCFYLTFCSFHFQQNMSRQQENVMPVLQRLEKNSQGHERVTETIHLKQEEVSK
jgi:hypothetical protein